MPRRSRKRSSSGLYHVMLRGINKQRLFHDDADYQTYLAGLLKYHAISGFTLYAYCLMPNHVHLLLRENPDAEPIGKIMRRLGTWYVFRYNQRYERTGPLFEGRYRSETVENDSAFLAVLRYIHRNPVKAGITQQAVQYPHSSCPVYFGLAEDSLIDTAPLFTLVPQSAVAAWHEQEDETQCLDVHEKPVATRLTDERAIKVMNKAAGARNLEEFACLDEKIRRTAIRKMHDAGSSLRQITRLTGESQGIVRKWIKV